MMLIVIEGVFVIGTTGNKQLRLRIGIFGINQMNFAGGAALQGNQNEMLGSGFMHADVKRIILFFINQFVVLLRRTQPMAPHLPG